MSVNNNSDSDRFSYSDAHCHIFPYVAAPGSQSIMVPPPPPPSEGGSSPCKSIEDVRDTVRRTRIAAAVMATDVGDMPTVHALRQLMDTATDNSTSNTDKNQGRVVPAFGVHPWYSYKYYIPLSSSSILSHNNSNSNAADDDDNKEDAPLTGAAKAAHYAAVLAPAPDAALVAALPDPISFRPVLRQIEAWLAECPDAMVGECGLDKVFRVQNPFYAETAPIDANTTPQQQQQPKFSKHTVRMAHQTALLRLQLELAARHARPVSLHCVKAPTALLDLVRAMALKEGTVLPALCLHSYTGSVEYLVNNWYASNNKPKTKKNLQQQQQQQLSFPRIYVSLSELFNNDDRHGAEFAALVRAVPADRLLLESDHYAGERDWAALNETVAASAAAALGVPVAEVVDRVGRNFSDFCSVPSV